MQTHTCAHTHARAHVLVWVVDVELLQEYTIIQEAIVHVGQELEDNAFLRPQEDHCVVLIRSCFIVHNDTCQAIPGRNRSLFIDSSRSDQEQSVWCRSLAAVFRCFIGSHLQ